MIDLHTHSRASDGSLSPAALAALAREAGVTYLALTDHNTAQGLPEFLRAARAAGVIPIPGAELTCELEGEELHILALDLPQASFAPLQQVLAEVLSRAEQSKRELTDNLRRAGYPVRYEEIEQAHPGSVINRAHIALALVEKGCASTVQEAFRTLLDEEAGYYHPAKRLQARESLSLIRELGAIPVWAHPLFKLTAQRAGEFLEILTPAGLTGLETFYSTYTPEQTRNALALADRFHLKQSGGSDFHGDPKPDIRIGTGRGNLKIPEWVAEELLYRC